MENRFSTLALFGALMGSLFGPSLALVEVGGLNGRREMLRGEVVFQVAAVPLFLVTVERG